MPRPYIRSKVPSFFGSCFRPRQAKSCVFLLAPIVRSATVAKSSPECRPDTFIMTGVRDSPKPQTVSGMALIYLDQNALIELGRNARSSTFRKRLDGFIETGSLNVVVSLWHLIETAHTKNCNNAMELAEFIDSIRPAWLLERRDIQKLEVQEDFYKFLKLEFAMASRVTT